MAVYSPALMLQEGNLFSVAYILLKAVLAIGLWGFAVIGYWRARLNGVERLWAMLAAFFLVAALPITDEIGLVLTVLLAVWLWFKQGKLTAKV
jgi:TRAP-type uncharacterized transport system fused permease subunit